MQRITDSQQYSLNKGGIMVSLYMTINASAHFNHIINVTMCIWMERHLKKQCDQRGILYLSSCQNTQFDYDQRGVLYSAICQNTQFDCDHRGILYTAIWQNAVWLWPKRCIVFSHMPEHTVWLWSKMCIVCSHIPEHTVWLTKEAHCIQPHARTQSLISAICQNTQFDCEQRGALYSAIC